MARPRMFPELTEQEYQDWKRHKKSEYQRVQRDKLIAEGKRPAPKYRHGNRKQSTYEGHLRRQYGIDLEQFARMYEQQGHACAVCFVHLPLDGSKELVPHVDHCHTTGKVRGLLCHSCNIGVGMLKDDPARLRQAANYLEGDRVCFPA